MNTKPKHQREGYRAYKAGKPKEANPHHANRTAHNDWAMGWEMARNHAALVNLLTDNLEESA
jgi:ribosome modulation factor